MSISVVIPAYNASRFLRATLDSVLAQTLPADEILVIDDGSTDDTAEIAKSYGPPVRVITTPNSKLAATRNVGVQEAKSEWIAFIDADDLWEKNKLELQMMELALHPEADICYTGWVVLLQEGDTARLGKVKLGKPAEKIRESLFKKPTFLPSSVVIRRSAFLAIGGHDTSLRYNEDWDTWLRLLHAGTKFAVCAEPLIKYRVHPDSISASAKPTLIEAKEIYRRHVQPHLPKRTRWIEHQKVQSEQEAMASFKMREMNDPEHLSMMMISILRYPFNELYRYKVFAHMIYKRLRSKASNADPAKM